MPYHQIWILVRQDLSIVPHTSKEVLKGQMQPGDRLHYVDVAAFEFLDSSNSPLLGWGESSAQK